MQLPRFHFDQPSDLEETLQLLSSGSPAQPIAGGTDLLVSIRSSASQPARLIDISRCTKLQVFEVGSRSVRIGALTTLSQIEHSDDLRLRFSALPDSADIFASVQIRNSATIGGNICNASPAAETVPPLMIAGAEVVLQSQQATRRISLQDFMQGPGETSIADGELLCMVEFPVPNALTGTAYLRFSPRKSMDLMTVGVAASVTLSSDKRSIEMARLCLGAVAPTAVRATHAESILPGARVDDEDVIQEAGGLAVEATSPISDVRASADYRRRLVEVMVPRALRLAIERARRDNRATTETARG